MYVLPGRMFSPHSAKDVCVELKVNITDKVDSNSTSAANGTEEVGGESNVQSMYNVCFTSYFTIM